MVLYTTPPKPRYSTDSDDSMIVVETHMCQVKGNNSNNDNGGVATEVFNGIEKNKKNFTLERQSNLPKSIVFLGALLVFEIGKQLTNFALSHQNEGNFPVPKTLLIVLIECLKMWLIIGAAQMSRKPLFSHGFSWKFSIPGLCYFSTGMMYLQALTMTSPPIWMILIQTRTLYVAIIYKIKFNMNVSALQMLGCLLIVSSIPLTRLSEIRGGHTTISLELIAMSQVAALLSSVACISVENFLKNDPRHFLEQQFNLYMWGIVSAAVALLILESPAACIQQLLSVGENRQTTVLLIMTVVLSALAGLCVPLIVKNLDSIVKDYAAALNNIAIAACTAFVFPSLFSLNQTYLLSLVVLLLGIFLYEKKEFKWSICDKRS